MIIYHLTIGTPFSENLNNLKQQSIDNGFQFINLSGNYKRGEVSIPRKIAIIHNFLKSNVLHDDAIILFTDGYDVCINDHSINVLRNFLLLQCDILFNAEKIFWPSLNGLGEIGQINRKEIFDFFDQKVGLLNKYLNSGIYIGYVGAIRQMINFCIDISQKYNVYDDQALMQYFAYQNQNLNIQLDYYDKLLSTFVFSEEDFSFDGMILKNHKYNTIPSILHANGVKLPIDGFKKIQRINKEANLPFYLYCLKSNDKFLAIDSKKKFIFTDFVQDKLCFLVQNRRKTKTCLLSYDGRYASFHPDRFYDFIYKHVMSWELLEINNNMIKTTHNYYLLDLLENSDKLDLVEVPFNVMTFTHDKLIDTLVNMSWS